LYAWSIVATIAVLREGSELVLFLYGIASAGPGQTTELGLGFALGLAAGLMLAVGMYFGLLRVPAKHLFAVTGWLILLLAAGMAAQGAAYLVQADILPALGETIWDTSYVLPDDSIIGKLMHTLVGYTARPYGIQLGLRRHAGRAARSDEALRARRGTCPAPRRVVERLNSARLQSLRLRRAVDPRAHAAQPR